MDATNSWKVESIEAFYFLKCPECMFLTQKDNSFYRHAIENHPMSFTLFRKSEWNENIILDSQQMDEIKATETGIILLIDQVVVVIFVR